MRVSRENLAKRIDLTSQKRCALFHSERSYNAAMLL
jgi:hypothetical protein